MDAVTIVFIAFPIALCMIWFCLCSSDLSSDELSDFAFDRLKLPDGLTLNYRIEGNPRGPKLLFVHGGGDSLSAWDGWAKVLHQDFCLINFDLPGHGLSDPYPDGLYSTSRLAKSLKALVETLELEDFILVGHSFGGETVLRYVVANPEAPKAMVLVSPGGYRSERGLKMSPPLAAFANSSLGRKLLRRFGNRRLFGLFQHKNFFYRKTPVSEAAIDRQFRLLRYGPNRGAMLALVVNDMTHHQDVTGLRSLDLPALFLWGREDKIVPLEAGRRMAGDVVGAKLIIYEEMGHVSHVEIPERTARDAKVFLESL